MTIRDQQVRALLDVVDATRTVELDCAEFLTRMAALAELKKDAAVPEGLRLAKEHAMLCANCREELGALQVALED
jgi:uncharacterized CHY-type Zn-finger protein